MNNGKFMPIPNATAFVMSDSLVHANLNVAFQIDAQDALMEMVENGG